MTVVLLSTFNIYLYTVNAMITIKEKKMSNLEFLRKGVNLNKSYKVFRFSQNLAWTSGLCTRYSNNNFF